MDFPGLHFRLPVQDFSNTDSSMPNDVDLRERGYLTLSCTDRAQAELRKEGRKLVATSGCLGSSLLSCSVWARPGLGVSDLQSQAYPHALKRAHSAASSTGLSCSWAVGITKWLQVLRKDKRVGMHEHVVCNSSARGQLSRSVCLPTCPPSSLNEAEVPRQGLSA